MGKGCSVVGCTNVIACRGLCNKHYIMLQRHGDPLFRNYEKRGEECKDDGCSLKVYSKGLCNKHWQRLNKHGSILDSDLKTDGHLSVKERLEKNKEIVDHNLEHCPGACHEWTKHRDKNGYGKISIKNKPHSAHRVSYETYVGPIPEGLWVLHKCDNPICFNPDHLYTGDNKQNCKDRADRGRTLKGADNGNSKLSHDQVVEIKKRLYNGETPNEIFPDYPVSGKCLRNIRDNKSWTHVPWPIPDKDQA